ncbi:hypothetical protein M2651_06485 [Clostridium sp. SYSU_GA19001]|uniref:hypothetical protein n=1 Tax=Clostridium caldaquaticum TaxID=2940653 RepID=UPI002077559D|nr:hypothetical protein [Clostridium caldaquaticum]MCM8710673.1 hypothetical protein [Clostridium caldaquaticum]
MANGGFVPNLANYIGQTVTVYTTSGGDSGRGFTGVLAMVNQNFIRLITQIGPAPGCALGSCCDKRFPDNVAGVQEDCVDGLGNYPGNIAGQGNFPNRQSRIDCDGSRGLGSVVDIPVNRIASFVHNAVGGGW